VFEKEETQNPDFSESLGVTNTMGLLNHCSSGLAKGTGISLVPRIKEPAMFEESKKDLDLQTCCLVFQLAIDCNYTRNLNPHFSIHILSESYHQVFQLFND
jgi:hypothetical protein